jgi:hypothetical protein
MSSIRDWSTATCCFRPMAGDKPPPYESPRGRRPYP